MDRKRVTLGTTLDAHLYMDPVGSVGSQMHEEGGNEALEAVGRAPRSKSARPARGGEGLPAQQAAQSPRIRDVSELVDRLNIRVKRVEEGFRNLPHGLRHMETLLPDVEESLKGVQQLGGEVKLTAKVLQVRNDDIETQLHDCLTRLGRLENTAPSTEGLKEAEARLQDQTHQLRQELDRVAADAVLDREASTAALEAAVSDERQALAQVQDWAAKELLPIRAHTDFKADVEKSVSGLEGNMSGLENNISGLATLLESFILETREANRKTVDRIDKVVRQVNEIQSRIDDPQVVMPETEKWEEIQASVGELMQLPAKMEESSLNMRELLNNEVGIIQSKHEVARNEMRSLKTLCSDLHEEQLKQKAAVEKDFLELRGQISPKASRDEVFQMAKGVAEEVVTQFALQEGLVEDGDLHEADAGGGVSELQDDGKDLIAEVDAADHASKDGDLPAATSAASTSENVVPEAKPPQEGNGTLGSLIRRKSVIKQQVPQSEPAAAYRSDPVISKGGRNYKRQPLVKEEVEETVQRYIKDVETKLATVISELDAVTRNCNELLARPPSLPASALPEFQAFLEEKFAGDLEAASRQSMLRILEFEQSTSANVHEQLEKMSSFVNGDIASVRGELANVKASVATAEAVESIRNRMDEVRADVARFVLEKAEVSEIQGMKDFIQERASAMEKETQRLASLLFSARNTSARNKQGHQASSPESAASDTEVRRSLQVLSESVQKLGLSVTEATMTSLEAKEATRPVAAIQAQMSNLNEQMMVTRANLSVAIDRSTDSLTLPKAKSIMEAGVQALKEEVKQAMQSQVAAQVEQQIAEAVPSALEVLLQQPGAHQGPRPAGSRASQRGRTPSKSSHAGSDAALRQPDDAGPCDETRMEEVATSAVQSLQAEIHAKVHELVQDVLHERGEIAKVRSEVKEVRDECMQQAVSLKELELTSKQIRELTGRLREDSYRMNKDKAGARDVHLLQIDMREMYNLLMQLQRSRAAAARNSVDSSTGVGVAAPINIGLPSAGPASLDDGASFTWHAAGHQTALRMQDKVNKSRAVRDDLQEKLGPYVNDSAEALVLPPIAAGGMPINSRKKVPSARDRSHIAETTISPISRPTASARPFATNNYQSQ